MPFVLDCVYLLMLAATSPYWLWRIARTGKYRHGLGSKFIGDPPRVADGRPVIWLHAVSVGEVLLLQPLIARLAAHRPTAQLVLSTTTNAGYDVARSKCAAATVFFAPFDFSWAVRRTLRMLRPRLIVLAELELWPNLLWEAKRQNVPVAVVSARLGERSFRGYRRLRPLLRTAFAAVRWWGAQTAAIADRIIELVDEPGLVEVTGSIKYDGAMCDRSNEKTCYLRALMGFRDSERVFVAGSTQAPEESIVLDTFQSLRETRPELRLILVPRHPERFSEVIEMVRARGLAFVRRSALETPLERSALVTILDSMGELAAVWGLADVGFVGGSLGSGRGGQSMIEPAAYGVPTCFGPQTWNFADTVERLLQAGGAIQIQSAAQLAPTLAQWLDVPAAANETGENARRFIAQQQGALDATLRALDRLAPNE